VHLNDEFKNFMSSIPTSVAVLNVTDEKTKVHQSCTISSFISLSVENDQEEIGFILRSNSTVGKFLEQIGVFSISFLSSKQSEIAKMFGGPGFVKEKNSCVEGVIHNETLTYKIRHSYAMIYCELSEILERKNSRIFLAKPIFFNNQENKPLIYLNRSFHSI
jgi:flavin reductase (DIM6/NTAB) family NADH-FMN oxidoreductase RutF